VIPQWTVRRARQKELLRASKDCQKNFEESFQYFPRASPENIAFRAACVNFNWKAPELFFVRLQVVKRVRSADYESAALTI
jgi:hypothetical protein